MSETRITDRERYTKIAEVMPEYKEWAEKKIAAMDARNEKRKGADKKPTKAQIESLELQPKVAELLTDEAQLLFSQDLLRAVRLSSRRARVVRRFTASLLSEE